jgi:hypothetical protein
MEGFFERAEQLTIYNRAFHSLEGVRDKDLRKRMTDTFANLRVVSREWHKLMREAALLDARYQQALRVATAEFERQGLHVERDVLVAVAQMMADFKV